MTRWSGLQEPPLAKIAVSARRKDLLEEVVKQVQELGGEAESFLWDVTNADQIANTVEAIIAHYESLILPLPMQQAGD